jgi:lipopolysaccharide transport system ATP-binding protein
MPLQNYSSDMNVKLGIAVSSQRQPDILLLDEVLAVDDVGFRAKCLQRMGELINRCAVIFVSHSMPSVTSVASKIFHLHHDETKTLTTSLYEAMSSYYGTFSTGSEIRTGTGEVEVERIAATCGGKVAENRELLEVNYGEAIEFKLECKFNTKQSLATIHILIWSQELIPVLEILGPEMNRFSIIADDRGMCTVFTTIPEVTLNTGRYTVSIIVLSGDGMTCFRMLDRALELQVNANHGSGANTIGCMHWSQIA